MNLSPQPGDRWTRKGFDDIEVVTVTATKVGYRHGKVSANIPRTAFEGLAANSIKLGAVLRRGGEVFSKELEDFEP